jgi:NAD(P)-dependent dehydrogenase (short-subunit alcohol dehydrogenase family)
MPGNQEHGNTERWYMKTKVIERVVLVTGANRGIGFEVCRQMGKLGYRVILTSRDAEKGRIASQTLSTEGLRVDFCQLDVSSEDSIQEVHEFVVTKYGRLDALVNNAGIHLDHDRSISSLPMDILRQTMETNAYGALRTCQVFLPMMRKQNYGRIVNVSSQMGQLTKMRAMSSAYRLSKVAMNAITQMLADSIQIPDLLVNCCHPGHVRTDMGGASAPCSVEEGADTIVWLATLPADGPTGGFFFNRLPLEW